MSKSTAQLIVELNSVNQVEAFDKTCDNAVSVKEHSEFDEYRFADGSTVRVMFGDDPMDFDIFEA